MKEKIHLVVMFAKEFLDPKLLWRDTKKIFAKVKNLLKLNVQFAIRNSTINWKYRFTGKKHIMTRCSMRRIVWDHPFKTSANFDDF